MTDATTHVRFVFLALGVFGCSRLTEPPTPEQTVGQSATKPTTIASAQPLAAAAPAPTPGGKMEIVELAPGNGPAVKDGDRVSVHYVGTLTNGEKFDSSRDRNSPFDFQVGKGQVIKGWDEGLVGMKVGGKRKLTIPSDKAYGPRAIGKIPANSTLVFEVELVAIK